MPRANAVALMLVLTLAPGSMLSQQTRRECDAPELVVRDDVYNRLVCSGIRLTDAGRNLEAINDFEAALRVNLDEAPNFRLLPRLAMTYWIAGDTLAARATLGKARVAISLLAGVYMCAPAHQSPGVVDSWGEPVNVPYSREIGQRMCGPAYENWYHRTSLESLLADAGVVRIQLEAERLIH